MAVDEALQQAIGIKKWHHCGVWMSGVTAYVVLNRKKPVKKTKSVDTKKEFGGKIFIQGICKPGPEMHFRFLGSDTQPQKIHLKNGMSEQLDGQKLKVFVGKSLDEYPPKQMAEE